VYIAVVAAVRTAYADAGDAGARLAAIAPADDARRSVAIGPAGEVYEPDGKGAWVRRLPCSTAGAIVAAGRAGAGAGAGAGGGAGAAIVALAGGAVYQLSDTGWSAIRIARRGQAIMNPGARSLAAVGRQLFALDALTRGEPTRLAVAPANIVAIGAGKGIVVATEAGAFRFERSRLVALRTAPARMQLVSDRWALVDRGALDLATGKRTAWPGELAIGVAAAGPDDALVAIGRGPGGLELVTLRRGKLARDPLGASGTAVGVVVDRAGRAVVALADGRIAMRDKGWTITEVSDAPAAEHPGAPPATY
jgi:hypothetical protein